VFRRKPRPRSGAFDFPYYGLVSEHWDKPFANGHLKVDRAKKHIADIEERLRASSDRYGPSMHMNLSTGNQTLDYWFTDSELRSDIALIVGDAVHNLHCALDIVWCGALKNLCPTAYGSQSKFPIRPDMTREQLETTLMERKVYRELIDFALDSVKCYKGGDADILALHSLDINDKHVVLIPMVTATAIEGIELQHEDGSISRFDISLLPPPNAYTQVVPFETKIKNHGEVIFDITFGEGSSIESLEVIPTLKKWAYKTGNIVFAIQRMAR
jgi:hypothetical protein